MEYREAILHIEGCNKEYIITTDGQILDINTRTPRKFNEHHKGYLKCGFYINGKYKQRFVHRLVLMTYKPLESMDNLTVDHLNHNKRNNELSNLEWTTFETNQTRAKEDFIQLNTDNPKIKTGKLLFDNIEDAIDYVIKTMVLNGSNPNRDNIKKKINKAISTKTLYCNRKWSFA